MKILLLTLGTRGDVQPFVTIGKKLRSAGHDVNIAADTGFTPMIAEAGLTHHPLPMDFQQVLQNPEMQEALVSFRGKIRAFRLSAELMNDQLSAMWRIGLEVSPDLILYHFKGAVAPYLGRRLNVPAWPVMLQPGFVPTRAYPQFLLSARSLGPIGNLVTHKLVGGLIRFGSAMMLRRWIKVTGTDMGASMDMLSGFAPEGVAPRIHAYSPQIVPLPPDMPTTETQVGYAFSDPEPYEPPEALQAFLTAGETPIFVGFGSMPGLDHARINTALLGALKLTGLRAVVATGWGGFHDLPHESNIHVLNEAPFPWLFPKVATVVHHGGSGTTHEGLRWGRPTVICPVFADQPFWGHQIARLGAGPPPVSQKRLTADRLARALDHALETDTAERAQDIATRIATENGATALTEMVNRLEDRKG